MSRAKKIGLGVVLAVLLLAALGAWLLPGVVRTQAEQAVAQHLHRRLTIESVHINPFTLALTVQGARLYEPDGQTVFASFDLLDVRASLASLWHFAPVVRSLQLTNPHVRVVLEAPHRYNFDDLLHPAAAPEKAAGAPLGFAVHNIQVDGGSIVVEDRPRHATHQVSALRIGIPMLSTLASEENEAVEPVLSGRVDGSDFAFKGRGLPFAALPQAHLHLDLEQLELPRYMDYLPASLPVDIAAGRMALHVDADFQMRAKQAATLQVSGDAAWHGVQGSFGGKDGWDFVLDDARLEARQVLFALSNGQVGWQRIALTVPAAQITERQRRRPLTTHISALSLELGAGGPEQAVRTGFAATVNDHGRLQLQGQTALIPLAAQWDVDVTRLDLLPFQPLLGRRLNLMIRRGEASLKGHVQLADGPGGLRSAFQGGASLANVAAVDTARAQDLLRWKSLRVDGIRVKTAPFSLAIQGVALTDFFARVMINPDGKINLQQLVKASSQPAATPAAASRPAPAAAGSTTPEKPAPVTIGKVVLQGGVVQFSDHYVQPHYSARLDRLGGAVTGLSSDIAAAADVDLRGEVNHAPLRIAGKINPLRGNLYLDIQARVTGMEMSPFSPYSGKYVGYNIEKGKLSFDVTYHVLDQVLTAQNHLILDQLTFGSKVDSPDATHLPVQLALALLKDRNGTIDVHLPIEGSIDDPQFSVGGIVLKMILNLLAKAVTSPFQLLGSFFQQHEAASWMSFEPGHAVVTADNEAKLRALAHALTERPGLKLDIEGHAQREADAEGLRRASIEQKVRALWVKAQLERGHAVSSRATVPLDQYPDLLRQAYKNESFPKPRNFLGLEKSLPVPEMEKLMMANTPVTEDSLSKLALHRAQAVEDWLVHEGQVPVDRLFIVRAREDASAPAGAPPNRVQFILK
ncbi:MAG: DUF748 domain-containing protein [Betaproteobacteria bacterium]|nr:DUF748 domain-containing protein [Betaproteobacteria bacterium]MDE2623194.1 DUF748 domain-containing protein [Betaproteobacteria bacterium]